LEGHVIRRERHIMQPVKTIVDAQECSEDCDQNIIILYNIMYILCVLATIKFIECANFVPGNKNENRSMRNDMTIICDYRGSTNENSLRQYQLCMIIIQIERCSQILVGGSLHFYSFRFIVCKQICIVAQCFKYFFRLYYKYYHKPYYKIWMTKT